MVWGRDPTKRRDLTGIDTFGLHARSRESGRPFFLIRQIGHGCDSPSDKTRFSRLLVAMRKLLAPQSGEPYLHGQKHGPQFDGFSAVHFFQEGHFLSPIAEDGAREIVLSVDVYVEGNATYISRAYLPMLTDTIWVYLRPGAAAYDSIIVPFDTTKYPLGDLFNFDESVHIHELYVDTIDITPSLQMSTG
jgi:hypothetical protein